VNILAGMASSAAHRYEQLDPSKAHDTRLARILSSQADGQIALSLEDVSLDKVSGITTPYLICGDPSTLRTRSLSTAKVEHCAKTFIVFFVIAPGMISS